MRVYIKEQLLKLTETIRQAHDEIGTCIGSGNIAGAVSMLAECQNAAISIGTAVEESEGEGTETVSLLERYCEVLYGINVNLQNNPDNNNASKIVRKLNGYMVDAANMIKYDIDVRKEVLFLPYKVSMWDSLESVWRAADNDPGCDAYVVPIPYFDKNPDGTFGQMHYEGGDYPDYVPVTSYEDYIIKNRRPDVIFIHNPYDSFNKVTSVHPEYYAKEIRKYTDKLVYIPYFVSGESIPRHFCVLPGTIYADYVIAENENVRDIYIEEFEKVFNQKVPDGKFLAMGSPKFDKITELKKEDYELPQEWLDIIDGRKVILYNTSVQNFMNDTEKVIEKIRRTINTVSGNSDIVLWWRPHPLAEPTLRAMKSEYYDKYMRVVDEYKRARTGIYDDTGEFERAIVYSDAYYGDKGSVPVLYEKTGKPIMYQDIRI